MRAQITMAAKDGDPPTLISHLNVHWTLLGNSLHVGGELRQQEILYPTGRGFRHGLETRFPASGYLRKVTLLVANPCRKNFGSKCTFRAINQILDIIRVRA